MGFESYVGWSYLIPLLPLIGAVISGFLGAKWLKGKSHWPIWIGVGISAVLSLTLLFGMLGEKLELHVAASNRDCYAQGALLAAEWLAKKPAGLYGMSDVLGL